MNNLESVIAKFISRWYDTTPENDGIFSIGERLYQIIQPSELLNGVWINRNQYGQCDITEVIDMNVDHDTDTLIKYLMKMGFYPQIFNIIKEGYYIKSIADLSDIVPVSSLQYLMIEYDKWQPSVINVCVYSQEVKYSKEFDLEVSMDEWDPILLDEEYQGYLERVNEWVFGDTNIKPADINHSTFFNCKYQDLLYFFEHLRPELLSSQYVECRKQLQVYAQNGKTEALGELVSIIYPKAISDEKSFYLNPTIVSSVLPKDLGKDISDTDEEIYLADHKIVYSRNRRSDTRLHKGDYYMAVPQVTAWCPIFQEPAVPIYAQEGSCVIRTDRDISLEYLFLYFETDIGRLAVDILSTKDIYTCLPFDNVDSIQVVLPQKEEAYYAEMVSTLYYDEYLSFITGLTQRQEEELLGVQPDKDLIQSRKLQLVNLGRNTNLRRLILLDRDEVYKCIKAKAYKSAIILCGSILEAILIDWVSELDNVNYFEFLGYDRKLRANIYDNNKRKPFRDNDGRIQSLELKNIINRIADLKPPVWLNDESRIAHTIRVKRNRVHASLAISNPVLTKEDCDQVIEYLETVLDTRGLIV